MTSERPITREDAEDLTAQIRRMMDSGAAEATLSVFGNEYNLSRESDGGYTVHAPDETISMRLQPASESRPAEYPADVPFISNEAVTISTPMPGSVSLIWWTPADPDSLLAELNQCTTADGWALTQESAVPELSVRQYQYEKDGVSRLVMLSAGMVSLIQERHGTTKP